MSWRKRENILDMFDLTPLSAPQLVFALVSFAGVFFILMRWRRKYAGTVLALFIVLLSLFIFEDFVLRLGLGLATVLIFVVGRADETKPLSAGAQVFWQLVVAMILAISGWAIPYVSNPLGPGIWYLGALAFPTTIIWIILMMNAMNWLDGLDGLASSVSFVAFLTLAGVSLLPATQDIMTLGLSLIAAGALLGFFLHNAPPARVYLGTTGSWFVGMFLALTALVGGGKVATATLVLALPVLDSGFVIIQRLMKRQRPWIGDKNHLHHRLLTAGFSVWQIIFMATALTAALGVIAVSAQTIHKLWALAAVALFLAVTILTLSYAHTATHH